VEGPGAPFFRQFDLLDFLQLLQAALHHGRLGGLVPEPVDGRLLPPDFVLLLLPLLLQQFRSLGLGLFVLMIVAGIMSQQAPVQFIDVRDQAVDEKTVMGYDHQAPPELKQVLLQPFQGRQVQVIGGFVQKEDVRVFEEQACKHGPHAPAPAEFTDHAVEIRLPKAQAGQEPFGQMLDFITVHGGKLMLQSPEPVEQGLVWDGRLLQPAVHVLHPGFDCRQFLPALHDCSQEGSFPGVRFLLGEISDAEAFGHDPVGPVRLQFPA